MSWKKLNISCELLSLAVLHSVVLELFNKFLSLSKTKTLGIPSAEGMLYKNTIVKLDEYNESNSKIRVKDSLGKVWWIEPNQVSCSFL